MRENRFRKALNVPDMPVEYIGQGYIHGSLYLVDSFPGVVYDISLKKRTYGEIYLIKANNVFLQQMDAYENSLPYYTDDPLYRRIIRPVHLINTSKSCWVYEFIKPTNNLSLIPSGRFLFKV